MQQIYETRLSVDELNNELHCTALHVGSFIPLKEYENFVLLHVITLN